MFGSVVGILQGLSELTLRRLAFPLNLAFSLEEKEYETAYDSRTTNSQIVWQISPRQGLNGVG